jgi:Na+/phosphate symporter
MEFPLTLMDLAGSVALLLWGVHMVCRPACSGLSEQNFETS